MSDSIQPIRYIPQTNKLNPKGRTGDKKDDRDRKQGFSELLPAKDKEVKGKDRNQEEEEHKNPEYHKKEDKSSLQTEKAPDLDDACGTILDTEV